MGILFGLIAALTWGTGDYVISRVSRTIGPLDALLYVQAFGIGAITLVLLVRGEPLPADPRAWGLAAAVNLLNVAGTLCLYRALAVGTVSIVSPLAASFAVVTAALAVLGGERPGALTLLGVAVVIGGVIVVARAPSGAGAASTVGVPAALGAALCYGLFFFLLGPVTQALGIAWPVLVGRLMTAAVAAALLLATRRRPVALSPRLAGAALLATSLDTTGFLSFNSGLATSYVSVVTALASIFSAVTVLLAWVLLRERLAASQWAGVAAVLAGVLMVSL